MCILYSSIYWSASIHTLSIEEPLKATSADSRHCSLSLPFTTSANDIAPDMDCNRREKLVNKETKSITKNYGSFLNRISHQICKHYRLCLRTSKTSSLLHRTFKPSLSFTTLKPTFISTITISQGIVRSFKFHFPLTLHFFFHENKEYYLLYQILVKNSQEKQKGNLVLIRLLLVQQNY